MLQQLELEVEPFDREPEIGGNHVDGRRAPHVRPDPALDAGDRFPPQVHRGII